MAPTPYTRGMFQYATYWPPGAYDGVGGKAFSNPTVIRCRWQDTSVLFRTPQGEEAQSTAVIYPDRTLATGGLLVLGDKSGEFDSDGYLNPESAGAREIRQVGASPSYSGTQQLNKAYL